MRYLGVLGYPEYGGMVYRFIKKHNYIVEVGHCELPLYNCQSRVHGFLEDSRGVPESK